MNYLLSVVIDLLTIQASGIAAVVIFSTAVHGHLYCFLPQKEPSEQPGLQYDEFGFKVDPEGNVLTHIKAFLHSTLYL